MREEEDVVVVVDDGTACGGRRGGKEEVLRKARARHWRQRNGEESFRADSDWRSSFVIRRGSSRDPRASAISRLCVFERSMFLAAAIVCLHVSGSSSSSALLWGNGG